MADIIDAIDFSFYQKQVNFLQLKTARVQGRVLSRAFVRAGQGTWMDSFFVRNWEGLRDIGWIRGSYFVCDPNSSGIDQARFYWGLIKNDEGDYRAVADLELPKRPTRADRANNWAFVQELEQLCGYTPIIYSRASWLDLIWDGGDYSRYPYWGAGYPRLFIPKGWTAAAMHQYFDGGLVGGINGRVDMNYVLDEAALLRPTRAKVELPSVFPAVARAVNGLKALSGDGVDARVLIDAPVRGVEVVVHEVSEGWARVSLKDLQGYVRVSELGEWGKGVDSDSG